MADRIIVIRQEQLDAMSRAIALEWAVAHVTNQFPNHFRAMGSDRMRVFVKRCVDRALTLGYRTQATYGRYLDLSLIFGENFDQREAWALAVGASGPDEAPLTRIDRLHQAGLARLEQLAGEREQELC